MKSRTPASAVVKTPIIVWLLAPIRRSFTNTSRGRAEAASGLRWRQESTRAWLAQVLGGFFNIAVKVEGRRSD